jgi:hypothetical protein
VIHLQPHHRHRREEQQPTTVYYSPEGNPQMIDYSQSTIPTHMMSNSPQSSNWRPIQANCYTYVPEQRSSNQFYGYSQ